MPERPAPVVTIAIPVYNALPQTLRCVRAVARTVGAETRVVVIDDASPDPEVRPALTVATREHGFELWVNDRNLGFVGTCNRVFSTVTQGHVLLLNSDTEPQTGWLEAMLAAVDIDVASVTAVSNNASIYSLPVPGAKPFSADFGQDELGDIVRGVISPDPIDIPVGIGFCMLFTRQALDAIGGFDPAYGVGYGEEDDWCMRAARKGMRHRLAPSAFVYHEGRSSMKDAGVLTTESGTHMMNEALLHSRYPDHPDRVAAFLDQPPIHLMRADVTQALIEQVSRQRPRLLHWIHADPWSTTAGGTERSVRRLVESLDDEFAQFIAFPGPTGPTVVERANGVAVEHHIPMPKHDPTRYAETVSTWQDLAGGLLSLTRPDVFHLHHGYRSSHAVALAAIEAGVPTVVSLHDFNLICPRNHLLDRWNSFCGVPENSAICDSCLTDHPASIGTWRSITESVLRGAGTVIVPDPSLIDIVRRAIELPEAGKVEVIVPVGTEVTPLAAPRPDREVKRRVVIPGRLEARHKGGLLIAELLERLIRNSVEVHSIGTDEFDEREGFVVHGSYEPEDLMGLLAEIDADLGIIPTIVPETFSMTLSELWAAGVPVLAADLGALARRIRASGAGWVTADTDAGGFVHKVLQILDDPEGLARARNKAHAAASQGVGSSAGAVDRHRTIYLELAATRDQRVVTGGGTSRTSL